MTWICCQCEEEFEGKPKHFLSCEEEPLCEDCFKISSKTPPNTIKISRKNTDFACDGELSI